MADVQTKNGFFQIATALAEALAKIRISGVETQCLWVIIRKTYGWKKKEDWISLSQFVEGTGLLKPNIVKALNGLREKNIIIKIDNGAGVRYGIQKDYDKWVPLSKKITVIKNHKASLSKPIKPVIKNHKASLSKIIPTIDTPTKYTFTKDTNTIKEIIEYLNQVLSTNYKAGSKKTQGLINTRLSEGHTSEDFKTVIDKKYAEWKSDPAMCKFLRPETLFGNKFESYLNQPDAQKQRGTEKTQSNWDLLEDRKRRRKEEANADNG